MNPVNELFTPKIYLSYYKLSHITAGEEDTTGEEEGSGDSDGKEEEESVSVDTTGDSDSSEEALNEENSKGIPEGLADDISELTGAFNYREFFLPIRDCSSITALYLHNLIGGCEDP